MLAPTEDMQLFVATTPVDMRKSINGLILEVVHSLGGNPQASSLYIFRNKNSNLIKALFWDYDGFVLIQKRLEKYKFQFPKCAGTASIQISKPQLRWLLSGFEFDRISKNKGLDYSDYC